MPAPLQLRLDGNRWRAALVGTALLATGLLGANLAAPEHTPAADSAPSAQSLPVDPASRWLPQEPRWTTTSYRPQLHPAVVAVFCWLVSAAALVVGSDEEELAVAPARR